MELPVIDLAPYLKSQGNIDTESGSSDGRALTDLCKQVANCLKEAGALVVRDPRCSSEDNDRFLDMMEQYFGRPDEFKRRQARPHLHYQVCVLSGLYRRLGILAMDAECRISLDSMLMTNNQSLILNLLPDPSYRILLVPTVVIPLCMQR